MSIDIAQGSSRLQDGTKVGSDQPPAPHPRGAIGNAEGAPEEGFQDRYVPSRWSWGPVKSSRIW